MPSSFMLVLLAAVVGASCSLTQFQQRFAEHSQPVEPELQRLRAENNQLRLQLIHQIIPQIARLTLDLRNLLWGSWELIENHEKTDENCLPLLRFTFNVSVLTAEVYINSLAQDMYWELRDDGKFRFNPSASFMSHENSRAIHQTVQTLGRNRFTDDVGATLDELQDELNHHHDLWVSYEEILRKELDAIQPLEKYIMGELDWWYDSIMEYHTDSMESLIDNIDYFCSNQAK